MTANLLNRKVLGGVFEDSDDLSTQDDSADHAVDNGMTTSARKSPLAPIRSPPVSLRALRFTPGVREHQTRESERFMQCGSPFQANVMVPTAPLDGLSSIVFLRFLFSC